MVSRSALALTITNSPKARIAERIILFDPVHLVRIEPVNGNGTRKRKSRRA